MKRQMLKFSEFSKWLNENMVTVQIDNHVVGHIHSEDEETKSKITKLASSSTSRIAIIDSLEGMGFPTMQAQLLFDIVTKGANPEKFRDYLIDRTITVDSLIGKKMNAHSINSQFEMDHKHSLEFFNFSWRTSPPMGPGEVYLSTILRMGKRPSGKDKGDVMIGNQEMEVKGPGARLIGQKGYGDAKSMRTSFYRAIVDIAKHFKLSATSYAEGGEEYDYYNVIEGKDTGWNITKGRGGYLEENLKSIAKKVKKFSSSDLKFITETIGLCYKTYLIGADDATLKSMLVNSIKPDGSIDIENYNRSLLQTYFNYYYSIENFHYFAMTNKLGEFFIMHPSDFMSNYDKGIIKIETPPSFSNAAGSQGGTFSISLK